MGGRGSKPVDSLVEPLTRREREILALLEQDLSNQEIAQKLTLALSSTKWHIQQIYGKLGVNNRRQAIARARELGLLQSSSPAPPASVVPASRRDHPLPTGTVTFLFTDLEGSTSLWERQPQQMSAALLFHNAALRRAIENHGGVVFKTIGDAFQAAFPTAPQALGAAIEGQRALQSAPWNELGPLKVRMGLHTGEAELDPGGDEYAVSHTKNRAARIMSAGHGGQVLLSLATSELLRGHLPSDVTLEDLGEHHLKGLLQPERIFQAVSPGLPTEFSALNSLTRPQHNLPAQLTSFIGREKEIEEVSQLVRSHRLVTLTGPGGSGKTRLSIRVAQEFLEDFPHGVWFAELAPISEPNLVPQVLAAILGLRDLSNRPVLEVLIAFLQSRQTLLVLDNCEHLIEASAHLADALLRACPRIRVLASSREALGVNGEMVFHVPSMDFPDPQQLPALDVFRDFEANRLFIERAQAVMPSFQATGQNAQAIAEVCRRLDGIPLAIELAAARVNLLRVEHIARRLEESFGLLVSSHRPSIPRHKTLRAAIDWSYNLLSEKERTLLRHLSVFSGGCTLDAAEAICAGEGIETGDILDLLSSLTNKSMVVAERQQGVETRYRLLETVRQYASEKLSITGESLTFHNQHLEFFLGLTEQAEPHLFIFNRERLAWINRLKADLDNLRAAVKWSGSGNADRTTGLRIAVAISRRFMQSMGYYLEARQWLLSGLEYTRDDPGSSLLRARALGILGWLALNTSDWQASRTWYEESIQLCRGIDIDAYRDLSWALWGLAFTLGFGYQEAEAARHLADESVAVARYLGSSPFEQAYLVMALGNKGRILSYFFPEEDISTTQPEAEESLRLVKKIGAEWDNGGGRWVLGKIAERHGDYLQALVHYEVALKGWEISEDRAGVANSNRLLSWLFAKQKDYQRALETSQQYLREWHAIGAPLRMIRGLADMGIFLSQAGSHATNEQWLHQAATLFGAARKAAGNGPIPSFPEEKDNFDLELENLRNQLDGVEFEQAWQKGQAMRLDEAVEFMLSIRLEDS